MFQVFWPKDFVNVWHIHIDNMDIGAIAISKLKDNLKLLLEFLLNAPWSA